jgi:hypothetical protein
MLSTFTTSALIAVVGDAGGGTAGRHLTRVLDAAHAAQGGNGGENGSDCINSADHSIWNIARHGGASGNIGARQGAKCSPCLGHGLAPRRYISGYRHLFLMQKPIHAAGEIGNVLKAVRACKLPQNDFGLKNQLDAKFYDAIWSFVGAILRPVNKGQSKGTGQDSLIIASPISYRS